MRFTRIVKFVLLGLVAYALIGTAQSKPRGRNHRVRGTWLAARIRAVCSNFDPNLNLLKNIRPDDPRATGAADESDLGLY